MAPITIQLCRLAGEGGCNITIEEDDATVQTIKEAFEDRYGAPVARQCLIFRGETLTNKTAIKTKRIRNNSKLYFAVTPRCSCHMYDPEHLEWDL